jgi:hypothetical protein
MARTLEAANSGKSAAAPRLEAVHSTNMDASDVAAAAAGLVVGSHRAGHHA